MVYYNCKICNYKTIRKYDFNKHLKTIKHLKKEEENGLNDKKVVFYHQKTTKNHQKPPKSLKVATKKPPKTTKIPPKNENSEKIICQFCQKIFSRKDVLNKHINKNCKIKKQFDKDDTDLKNIIDEHKKEKNKLYAYIDKLIDKTGNTNINIEKQMNNTINLNNFGEEDISHITNDFKLKMLSLPYGMIQNMIEKVHFNKKKPENKNIALTNKRDNMIRIFKGCEWKYQDRSLVVDELIKKNYYRLDDFFEEEGKSKMNDIHNNRYKVFQNKFDKQDDNLLGRIKKDTEMIILSENL